ncbi:MAG TPA: hypothetical protein VJR89_43655, partial [Polyangiales bacterium]|nr:hypothetical protein [Polyangiales bacterium]
DLTVCDPLKARDFYQTVLGFMGYRLVEQDARGFDFDCAGPGRNVLIDRHRAGRRCGARARARSLLPPSHHDGAEYYAPFFAHPDGLKLEFVYARS